MASSLEVGRIQGLMERLNAKNPFRASNRLPDPPRAGDVFIDRQQPSSSQLDTIQSVLETLQYNFLPNTFFCLEKHRPYHRIVATARDILQESLPIRCLEATFVALLLSNPLKDVERFPIAFKSKSGGRSYRHIVLGIKHKGLFGALGLSRSGLLKDKPITFRSINDLLGEYFRCYQQVGHELSSLKLGLYFSHDGSSKHVPCWRFISLSLKHPLQSFHDDLRTTQLIDNFELLQPLMSDQFFRCGSQAAEAKSLMLISPTVGVSPQCIAFASDSRSPFSPSSPESQTPQEDEEVSDSEENQRRLGCLLAMQSPFANVPSGEERRPEGAVGKFSSKLRRAVHGSHHDALAPTDQQQRPPVPQQRSNTVPAGRHRRVDSTGCGQGRSLEDRTPISLSQLDAGSLSASPVPPDEVEPATLDSILYLMTPSSACTTGANIPKKPQPPVPESAASLAAAPLRSKEGNKAPDNTKLQKPPSKDRRNGAATGAPKPPLSM